MEASFGRGNAQDRKQFQIFIAAIGKESPRYLGMWGRGDSGDSYKSQTDRAIVAVAVYRQILTERFKVLAKHNAAQAEYARLAALILPRSGT
jgi:hypothetical protein